MQIIPTDRADNIFGFFSGAESGGDFFLAMRDALNAVDNGSNVSVSSALNENQPLVESPYTRHSSDGVTYELSEVCFTKQELQELREQLIKEGAPEESLRQFDILADQPDGATLAQVMASLMGKGQAAELSDDDIHAITALLGQIDPTGQLAGDAIAFMRDGNGSMALELIQNALAQMGSGESIDLDMAGALALGRGLGLNADSLNGLLKNFGGSSGLRLNAGQFYNFLSPARNQFMTEAANADKLETALEKTLKQVISKARDRMEKEKAASELQNRRVEQSRILIDRTVQKNSREMIDQTVAGGEEKAGNPDKTAAGGDGKISSQFKNNASNAENAVNAKNALNGEAALARNTDGNAMDSGQSDSGQTGKGKSDVWQNLLGKIEVKAASGGDLNGGSIVYSMLQGNAEFADNLAANEILRNDAQLSQRLASQVERGMLTAMRNGATRLDLQLHPAELGSIGITLIARNGEVTAQIRSEKSETAEMVTRQMDQIRFNLEQQGVKVDRIEVQIENRQDNSQNLFGDLGQHNARQEEDARRQELNRLRNLASIRNNRINSDNSVLEQPLHNIGQSARYAGQALHVVA